MAAALPRVLPGGAALVGLLALLYWVIDDPVSRLPLHIDGITDAKFQKVHDVFRQNFADGWERGGASFAVYWKGRKVVDLWGGYADRRTMRKWEENTVQVAFSTTKGVAAVALAMLVDRGRLSYDDLVTDHWPEFGQHGKGNLTVQQILTHKAGLPFLDDEVSQADASDHAEMGRRVAAQKPAWPPGTAAGYHIYTYGWMVDQLIRHVDAKRRGVGQFVREEITQPHAIDFNIGFPKEQHHRVARLSIASIMERISEIATDYRVLFYYAAVYKFTYESFLTRALKNLPWHESVYHLPVNDADLTIEQAASLGIGNARSLAQIFNLLGEGKLVRNETLDTIFTPPIESYDLVLDNTLSEGCGFSFLPLNRAGVPQALGRTGHGCQQVQLDRKNSVVIAYTSNALKTGSSDLCRTWTRLQGAVYDALEDQL